MKTGLSLQELAAKITANSELKRDFIVPTEKATMQVIENKPVLEIPTKGVERIEFPLLPLAHDQIGGFTSIPAKYYDRMLAEAPDLLATNVNAWFRKNPKLRMVRTLRDDVRAFLSNSYQRIENEQVAEVALNVLSELPGVQLVSSEVTDRRLYIHFVVPTIEGEVKRGDVVQAGGIIQNSEVGCGSVAVSGLIWRLVCLNGMKTQEAYRRNHVGRKVDDNEELWAEDTRKVDDSLVLLKLRDTVRAVVDETRFRQNVALLNGLTSFEMRDPERTVEELAKVVPVTEGERKGILHSLLRGNDLSAWGVVNAVTAQAHTAGDYDRAVELESFGGTLAALPAAGWRELAKAA